jgi:hypothetical protein
MNLLKSYFNSNIKYEIFKTKSKPLAIRYKRLSTKRVFVGKGELKHTNNNVIITFYTYNTEGMYLSKLYNKEKKALYYPNLRLKKKISLERDTQNKKNNKVIITFNRKFMLAEMSFLPNKFE